MMKIILASASLGRKKILEDLGLKFEVIPAEIDEKKITDKNPVNLVKKIAKEKALAVLGGLRAAGRRLPSEERNERSESSKGFVPHASASADHQQPELHYLIIAADSMVYFKGKTYGKPKDKVEAKKMLGMLSGQTHEFITGLCVIKMTSPQPSPFRRGSRHPLFAREGRVSSVDSNDKVIYQRAIKSIVKFGKFTNKEIDDFVKTAEVTSFAGGYTFELKGSEILRPKTTIIGSKSNMAGLPLEKLLPILKQNGIKIPRLNLDKILCDRR